MTSGAFSSGSFAFDVGQAMKPAADFHGGREDHLNGPDHTRGTVSRERGGGPQAPVDHVTHVLAPAGLGALVPRPKCNRCLAVCVETPSHKQGLFHPMGPVDEKITSKNISSTVISERSRETKA